LTAVAALGLLSCASSAWEAPARDAGGYLEAAPVASGEAPAESKAALLREFAFESAAPDAPAAERQVIWVASMRMAVVSTSDAQAKVQSFAQHVGGHVQESETRSITVRVPAAHFEAVLARIAALGEVVERNLHSSDVTEEMFDAELRLGNLRKSRERLLAHLEQSVRVEDTLKIEAELTRVTGEIEAIEGRLRYLASQVAMSTIRVDFDARTRPGAGGETLSVPFPWIARLGDGLVAGAVETRPRKPSFFDRLFSSSPDFTPPPEFIRYYEDARLVEALGADGVRIKVQRHDNYDEGALGFWSELAGRALVRGRGLTVTVEESLGEQRSLLRGVREVAGVPFGYLLVILRDDDELCTFEAWGPGEAFDAREAALRKSARTLEL
jgi:hypothetical protein